MRLSASSRAWRHEHTRPFTQAIMKVHPSKVIGEATDVPPSIRGGPRGAAGEGLVARYAITNIASHCPGGADASNRSSL
jgi:hypothetical protein